MSELVATRVLVRPGADVRTRRGHKPCRVVGCISHASTGQQGVCVEGPEPGEYTYYTLAAFAEIFEPAGGEAPPAPEKAIVHKEGSGF